MDIVVCVNNCNKFVVVRKRNYNKPACRMMQKVCIVFNNNKITCSFTNHAVIKMTRKCINMVSFRGEKRDLSPL